MRRIGYFSLLIVAFLSTREARLKAGELHDLYTCGCQVTAASHASACDVGCAAQPCAGGRSGCPAPGCGAPGCGAPGCGAPKCGAPKCGAPKCGAPTCAAPGCEAPGCEAPGCEAPGCGVPGCGVDRCDAVADACQSVCRGGLGCDCGRCNKRWSVLAEAVFLRRSDSGSVPLIIAQGEETLQTLVNANNLEFRHQAVPLYQLMYEDLCTCWGWDIVYFGTDSWSTSRPGGGEVSPALVGPGDVFGSTAPGWVFQVADSTNLYSAEFNVRRRCHECVTLLAGFRWIELSDELSAYSIAPTLTDYYSVDADNHLYGFQIGADATLLQPAERFRVDGIFRVGVLGNNADQTTRIPFVTGSDGVVDRVGAKGDDTSFMAELGLRGVLQLTPCLAVTGGYRALWLDGLALAPEQVPATSFYSPGSAVLNTKGELLFHGASVGLQLCF